MPALHPILLIPLFTAMAILFLLAYVAGMRARTPIRRSFLVFASGLFAVALFEFLIKMSMPAQWARGLVHIGLTALAFLGVLYLNFVLTLVGRPRGWLFRLLVLAAVTCAASAFLPGMFHFRVTGDPGITLVIVSPTYAAILGIAIMPATIASTILCILHFRRSCHQPTRRVIGVLLQGTVVSSIVGFGMIVFIPIVLPAFSVVYLYTSFSLLIHGGYFFVAVTRYNLITLDAQEKERHARKLETVGRLAEGIAHNFNNQITAIVGYTELARRRLSPSSPERPLLDAILQCTDRSTDLIRSVLRFGRAENHLKVPISLHSIIAELNGLLACGRYPSIVVEMSLAPSAPVVLGDPSALQNALLNLCVNACDAMEGSGVLRIETVHRGDVIHIQVSDTGCGIPAHVLERIFEPFFTTKPDGVGTGLGLSSVLETITAMDGQVKVASTPGRGTTFTIRLPAAPSSTPCTRTAIQPEPMEGGIS